MADSLLIIEDEDALARELEHYFSAKGWDVGVAGRLSQAREILTSRTLEPLVILADMSLPDGNA
ncbi:MAG: sigma-54-dependent Fis family transcriptional regulator, partial [Wenzhouxiangella sp.]